MKLLSSRIFKTMMISLDVSYAVSQTNMIIKLKFSSTLELISLTTESIHYCDTFYLFVDETNTVISKQYGIETVL